MKKFSNDTPVSPESVAALCRAEGLPVPEQAVAPLTAYLQLLLRWNRVMNLVGARTWQTALTALAADSFYLAAFLDAVVPAPEPEVWDLGAGAGLPGVPLRMVWQRGNYHLVEAREKRALFLSTVLSRLSLPRTAVFQGRAEAFFSLSRRPADVIVSRAFLPWPEVLALVRGQMAAKGRVVFLALESAPCPPAPWKVTAQREYAAGGVRRWFWAMESSE